MVSSSPGRMRMVLDGERASPRVREKRQLPSLVQSCSLPGITCDPKTQNTPNLDTTTSTPAMESSTHLPGVEEQTVTPFTPPSGNETSTPPFKQGLLRHLKKRSMSKDNGVLNKRFEGSHRFLALEKPKIWQKNDVLTYMYLILRRMLAKSNKNFNRVNERIPERGASIFQSGAFKDDFGSIRSRPYVIPSSVHHKFDRSFDEPNLAKRKPEMTSSGFHGDTFSGGFGDFDVMKRRPEMTSSGFHGDTFSGGFGDFDIMKRKPEMTSSGFHGDTFSGGFGDFDVMKRRPEMTSSGFHGDTFSGGFGDFDIMKRKPEMTSSGFHGDTFSGGFGDFDVMKRRPEMTSSGFHGDTFSGGFGDFDIMKRKKGIPLAALQGFMTFSKGSENKNVVKRAASPMKSNRPRKEKLTSKKSKQHHTE